MNIIFADMILLYTNKIITVKKYGIFLKPLFFSILFFIIGEWLTAQNRYPANFFRKPLNGRLYLSGSFGELRSGHFHSGIDIKTGGIQGKKVYAIANGYVSRIKISLEGYGRALYITHPNGYTSVYGHLQRYNDTIQQFVKQTEYKNEHYLIEIFPKKDMFPVKKGEVIAYSGNSGSSGGPHLHFEIRDEKTQNPINPLLFKSINVADHRCPRIVKLAIYPVNDTSLINGKNDTLLLPVYGNGQNCYLKIKKPLKFHGNISFGIRTYDVMDNIHNKNGIFNIETFVDSIPIFGFKTDKLSFYTTRYINSLIDYRYYIKHNKRFIRTEVDTNNRLFNYYDVKNSGIINFDDDKKHKIRFIIKDANGNLAALTFFAFGNHTPISNKLKKALVKHVKGQYLLFNKPYLIKGKYFKVNFPAHAFYRSFHFRYREDSTPHSCYSHIIILGDKFIPVQKRFPLYIMPDTFPTKFKDKMYIAKLDENNGQASFVGGEWEKKFLYTKVREFGNYTILVDTTPPIIKPLNFPKGKLRKNQKTLQLEIKDSQTGIKSYRATVNGKWLLFEYDKKNNLLTYFIDKHLTKGKNRFILKVIDYRGNVAVFRTNIIR